MHPQELLATVLRALVERGLSADDVDDVVMGNGEHAGDHANDIARSAVLTAGWPVTVPGLTVNRFCGGGQQAVMAAATGVLAGWQDLVVAGGVESMSRHTYGRPLDAGNGKLRERYPLVPQGIAADLIATLEGFDRTTVDQFAVTSQERAAVAAKEGRFNHSLVAVYSEGDVLLDRDEHLRPGTTVESLSGLPASFERSGGKPREDGRSYDEMCVVTYPEAGVLQHVHHAGNSSGVVDGAAAMVVASSDYATANGLRPRARLVTGAVRGAEPVIMLTAPGPAARVCLDKAGMAATDIDLWEINEAFAAVPLKVIRDLAIDPDKVNVNGGAIALGHPIGATGAMLFQTVLDELERRDLSTGLVTMCTGGGMATATIIERV
ncbi:acetyl-CoA C-acyltransferase [Mycolicibacterium vanbaalenii]|uniref:acetyl-CoA C-acyltransferase n=1 Tax=Mycolicibacterium vanbaalenii TaxID=110539 RepID=UPI001F2327B3